MLYHSGGTVDLLSHEEFDVLICCANASYAKFLNKDIGNIGGEEAWERGAEMDILYAEI